MVEQAARRGGDDVASLEQRFLLLPVAHAAKEQRDLKVHEAGKVTERGLHLHGEFARRFEDEAARELLRRIELGENRQAERSSLAGAGLGGGDQVLSREYNGNGLKLNG